MSNTELVNVIRQIDARVEKEIADAKPGDEWVSDQWSKVLLLADALSERPFNMYEPMP